MVEHPPRDETPFPHLPVHRGAPLLGPQREEGPLGDFTPGRYAWLLKDIEPIDPPVPAKGRQGLWYPDREAVPA
jgi:hypothetical protein